MTIEKQLVDAFFEDEATYKEEFYKTYEKVAQSKAIYKGAPVPYLHIPKFYSSEDWASFKEALDGIHQIAKKTISLYIEKPEIQALYGFDARLDALIKLPHHYQSTVPMGRFDIFYYGPGQFQFCELNADGASAMNEDFELSKILLHTDLVKSHPMYKTFEPNELYHSWVKEVWTIYGEYTAKTGAKSEKPCVAIVDFIDKGSSIEFEVFKAAFIEAGFDCEIVDPRDIQTVDGQMRIGDKVIDIVYRRLVTKDLMDRYDEIPAFIEGLKADKTCVVGSIKTQVIHTKRFFEVLYEPVLRKYFTEAECAFIDAHVPYTRPLKKDDQFEAYLADRAKYIIKPIDYYASKGVCAGKDYTDAAWADLLNEKVNEDFIIQTYCPVALVDNLLADAKGQITAQTFNTITGLFTYNEKLSGVYVRAGLNAIISGLHDGFTMATIKYL